MVMASHKWSEIWTMLKRRAKMRMEGPQREKPGHLVDLALERKA